jgi:hypothetical protein
MPPATRSSLARCGRRVCRRRPRARRSRGCGPFTSGLGSLPGGCHALRRNADVTRRGAHRTLDQCHTGRDARDAFQFGKAVVPAPGARPADRRTAASMADHTGRDGVGCRRAHTAVGDLFGRRHDTVAAGPGVPAVPPGRRPCRRPRRAAARSPSLRADHDVRRGREQPRRRRPARQHDRHH